MKDTAWATRLRIIQRGILCWCLCLEKILEEILVSMLSRAAAPGTASLGNREDLEISTKNA